jgi:sulfonate transport system permease protein
MPEDTLTTRSFGTAPAASATPAATATTSSGYRNRRSRKSHGWYRLISPVVAVLVWELVSVTHLVSARSLPAPTTIAHTAYTLITQDSPAYGTLQDALWVSLQRMAIGFIVGAAVALVLGLIVGLSRPGETAVDPLLQIVRMIPLFGLPALFIVWFGIGELPKIILIAIGAAIPLYLNTFAGIRSVDSKLAETGQVLGLSKAELIRHVILPGALPQILVGLRQSLGVAWLALVVAEQINTSAGLGFMINQATQFLDIPVIMVALCTYAVLGLITDWIVRILERKALTWRRGLLER